MRQGADKGHTFNFANLKHFKGFSTNFFLIIKTWGAGLVIIIFCMHTVEFDIVLPIREASHIDIYYEKNHCDVSLKKNPPPMAMRNVTLIYRYLAGPK